jgi:hypothetical protein
MESAGTVFRQRWHLVCLSWDPYQSFSIQRVGSGADPLPGSSTFSSRLHLPMSAGAKQEARGSLAEETIG